jgi:DnaJ-class molecular chaperone
VNVAAVGVVVLVVYLAACSIWPYTSCSRCKGRGRLPSPSGKSFRRCTRCAGSGDRERWGHALFGRKR